MPLIAPQWGDDFYDLLFKCVNNSATLVSTGTQVAKWGDSQYDLLFKLANNLDAAGGGSGGAGIPQITTAPSGINDFSMFPGGVAPSSGVYFAPLDISNLWTYEGGDAQWTVLPKSSP